MILYLIIFSGCHNNTNHSTVKEESVFNFDLKKDFKITSYQKIIETYPKSDLSACENWTIEKQDLRKIMQSMKSIQGEEWHHSFDHLPCEITGELIQNNNIFKYSINSGSWISISTLDTTIWFGDVDKLNEVVFMNPILDMENK